MFKFIDFTGKLTAPITDTGTVLPITVSNKICLEIEDSEDFTIFKISDDIHIEYVKVIDCNPDFTVNVDRGFFEDYPAVPFGIDACVDGVCCDEVVFDWFVCQSSCLDSVVCDLKTDTPQFFEISRDEENNCEVIINFLGYAPGIGIGIIDNVINVDLCSFADLVEDDLLSTDEFIVCKEGDLYNLSLAELCSYILDKIISGGGDIVLGFELPIENKGTVANPIVGMEEIFPGNQNFFGAVVDKFGRVTSVGPGVLPSLPNGIFTHSTVTVAGGLITNVAAGTAADFGVQSVSTDLSIQDIGTATDPDLRLIDHLGASSSPGPFTVNKYGLITNIGTLGNKLNGMLPSPTIDIVDGVSTSTFNLVAVTTAGIYNGLTVDQYGRVLGAVSPSAVTSQTVGQFIASNNYSNIEQTNCVTTSPANDTILITFSTPYNSANYHVSVLTDTGIAPYSVSARTTASVTVTFSPALLATQFSVVITGYA